MLRSSKQISMTEGPLLGKIIRFTIPLILTGILQLMFNAVDLAVVGKFSGEKSMAAVGGCGALINLIVNLFMGLSIGAGVLSAQAFGAKRYDEVHRLISTSIVASLVGGVAVGIFGFCAARPLLSLMGTPDNVLEEAIPYMRAVFCGMPGNLLYNYLASILRSYGDTRRPLIFLTVAGVSNALLNLVMVLSFHLGALGVGIATALSQYISAILIVVFLCRTDTPCRIRGLSVDGSMLWRMIAIGFPAGLQGMLFSLSNVLIQSTVNAYGDIVMAGNSAGGSLDGFVYITQNAVYQATVTFVGQNVGAGKYQRIPRIIWLCLAEVTVIGMTMGGLVVGFGPQILELYVSAESKEAVITAAMNRLMIMCTTHFLCGWMEVGCGALRGIGKAFMPMTISLIGSCLFRIVWIYTVCPLAPENITVLYISYPVSWILTAATHFLCFGICFRRMLRKREPELPPIPSD